MIYFGKQARQFSQRVVIHEMDTANGPGVGDFAMRRRISRNTFKVLFLHRPGRSGSGVTGLTMSAHPADAGSSHVVMCRQAANLRHASPKLRRIRNRAFAGRASLLATPKRVGPLVALNSGKPFRAIARPEAREGVSSPELAPSRRAGGAVFSGRAPRFHSVSLQTVPNMGQSQGCVIKTCTENVRRTGGFDA